jgi:prepilin-type N-terminal cleavage/methylation domain-containing protein
VIKPPHPLLKSFRDSRGMTLTEVMVAMLIFGLMSAGVVAGLVQSRRLTEGSVAQASAQAAVESYMDQLESMSLQQLLNLDSNNNPQWTPLYAIPTQKTEDPVTGLDPLVWSNIAAANPPAQGFGGLPTIPQLSTLRLTPGVTPAGVVDNLKEIPADTNNPGAQTTWNGKTGIWPGANYGTANLPEDSNGNVIQPHTNNLHVNIWVWVSDLSDPNPAVDATLNPTGNAQAVYGITIIYTWQFNNGLGTQYYMGTLHTVRSSLTW